MNITLNIPKKVYKSADFLIIDDINIIKKEEWLQPNG